MKGYDAFAGVVKSGGKTRRAAKMVILDAGHPDILDFIDSKAHEEKKAWALIEQGYDPSFTGEAYGSVFFQNANHSVRVTDEFMQAVERRRRLDHPRGRRAARRWSTYKARDIFRRMADAAHLCGDPGIQYDTTINDWNPVSNTAPTVRDKPVRHGRHAGGHGRGLALDRISRGGARQRHRRRWHSRIRSTGSSRPARSRSSSSRRRSGYRVRITADHKVATTRGDIAVEGPAARTTGSS